MCYLENIGLGRFWDNPAEGSALAKGMDEQGPASDLDSGRHSVKAFIVYIHRSASRYSRDCAYSLTGSWRSLQSAKRSRSIHLCIHQT